MTTPVYQANGTVPTQIEGIDIPLPYPLDFWALMAIAGGMTFGRAFGKRIDCEIQQTEWFKKQGFWVQQVVTRLLDCLHHWWIGVIIMYAVAVQSNFVITTLKVPESLLPPIFYFGFGLFLDDIRDVQHILKDRLGLLQPEEEETTPPTTTPPTTPPVVNP